MSEDWKSVIALPSDDANVAATNDPSVHWVDMPEFVQEKKEEYAKIIIRVDSEEDLQALSKALGQRLTKKTKSAWYPFRSHWGETRNEWVDDADAA